MNAEYPPVRGCLAGGRTLLVVVEVDELQLDGFDRLLTKRGAGKQG